MNQSPSRKSSFPAPGGGEGRASRTAQIAVMGEGGYVE
eukprot:gene23657-biopygen11853